MTKEEKWFHIWRDNSDPFDKDKGILCFSKMLFPTVIDMAYDIPEIHLEMYMFLLQMFHKDRTNYIQRQTQFELARDMSKSTTGTFILPLYLACYNGLGIIIADTNTNVVDSVVKDEKLPIRQRMENCLKSFNGVEAVLKEDVIVIMSETLKMAETWTLRIRREISVNQKLIQVFGRMKPESIFDDEGKWTASQFKVLKDKQVDYKKGRNVSIVAKGANQQIRGLNIDGRVTTFIFDDLYSQKNTITPESRQKIRYAATAEAKNGIDKNTGKVVFIGTKVHEDTLIEDNEKNKNFIVVKHTAMDKDQFMYVVNNYCKVDSEKRTCEFPNMEKCKELEASGYITVWPKRLSLYILLSEYAEAFSGKVEGKTLSMFWQEKFHEVLSEEDKVFKRKQMKEVDLELIHTIVNGNKVSFVKVEGEYRNVNLSIGIDAAVSYSERADDTAIMMIGKDYHSRIYFLRLMNGKLATQDEFKPEVEKKYLETLCLDRSQISRVGSTDEVYRWLHKTNANCKIVIETNNIGSEICRIAYKKRRLYGMYYPIVEVVSTTNKIERIADTLSPYHEAGSVYYNKAANLEPLKSQLEFLGKTTKDDCADIAATLVAHSTKPNSLIYYSENLANQSKKEKTWFQKTQQKNSLTKTHRDVWTMQN